MNKIEDQIFDEERALYHLQNAKLINVKFSGPADGESALKESRNLELEQCKFELRYPLWHSEKISIFMTIFSNSSRASIWYAKDIVINQADIWGVKAVRECQNIVINNSVIKSDEFGWKSNALKINNSEIESSYLLFDSTDIELNNVKMKGKYSFQYVKNLIIKDSILDTKDAFWHADNVIVKDSIIKGEYLGWYSKNLTFINCTIIGIQPLCYAQNLKLENCEMVDTTLAFEYSSVEAVIIGNITSVKNPLSGTIVCNRIDELILEDSIYALNCKIVEQEKR